MTFSSFRAILFCNPVTNLMQFVLPVTAKPLLISLCAIDNLTLFHTVNGYRDMSAYSFHSWQLNGSTPEALVPPKVML